MLWDRLSRAGYSRRALQDRIRVDQSLRLKPQAESPISDIFEFRSTFSGSQFAGSLVELALAARPLPFGALLLPAVVFAETNLVGDFLDELRTEPLPDTLSESQDGLLVHDLSSPALGEGFSGSDFALHTMPWIALNGKSFCAVKEERAAAAHLQILA